MAENCTIYCKINNLTQITQLVQSHFPMSQLTSSGDVRNSVIINGDEGHIQITHKTFRARGDDFCRLLLSTCAFIEGLSNVKPSDKKRLAAHVESCELVLGIVVEPAFDSDKRYHRIIFSIAKALDGLIFNGHEMLAPNGETLLSAV